MTKDDFIRRILGEAPARTGLRAAKNDTGHVGGFDFADDSPESEAPEDTRFAQLLLEERFGLGQSIPRSAVIRSADAVARYIPQQVLYWPKTLTRPHHTLLIEASLTHRELLAMPAFKSRQLAHLDIAEDAVARLVAEALEGFQRGADGLEASALKGRKVETLCVVSIIDQRDGQAGRLVCFGTFNVRTEGLETFFLTEHARMWDRADARDRLGLIYERQFKKLGEASWQEAFTTTDERKQAEKLLEVCTMTNVAEKDLQESILDLLDTIAKGFGLRKKPNVERLLQAFPLPDEHDIGIDSEERENQYGGTNPFSGVTLRDERSRLLGYIVYPLKTKADAQKLRQHLEKHNRFHNVLVVYPDANQASLELWQGREQLTGKLRKGQSHKDAADVVNLLSRFFVVSKAKARNPAELAQELAYRARYLRRLALKQLQDEPEDGQLRTLYSEFKKALVHDLSEPDFADAFAQTLTYSLLTARWVLSAQGETSPDRFSRKEAMKRLSVGSRFLAEMFEAVLTMELEDRGRLLWLVDDIADLLDRIDIVSVFKPDGTDLTSDPVIHFYEPFLAAYDAKIRMKRGAFYTPQPVVFYIVRSVHELLQTEFGLADGLADTTTWGVMLKKHPGLKLPPFTDAPGEERTIDPDEPFVQILDPATGTATFLVEVIDVIHRTLAAKWKQQRLTDAQQRAAWNDYVPQHLLPRLHAFELMMAPYAIAHMKIGLKLAETGYRFGTEERARIYLTNALEPWVRQLPLIGFPALAHEAEAVNEVKRHKRFTVVIGNPPYSVSSQNDGEWIVRLCDDFKRGLEGERNIQPLSDDYIKFLRLSIFVIEQSGAGIHGMVTNREYIQGVIHRSLRRRILEASSRIAICDLHGQRGERLQSHVCDENVFEIEKGVAIGIFVFGGATPGQTHYGEIVGGQDHKLAVLATARFAELVTTAIEPSSPFLFFKPWGDSYQSEYEAMPSLLAWFGERPVTGFATHRDSFAIAFDRPELTRRIARFIDLEVADSVVRAEFDLGDTRDWNLSQARRRAGQDSTLVERLIQCTYRPFDLRWVIYSDDILEYSRRDVMQNVSRASPALVCSRIAKDEVFAHVFVSAQPVEKIALSPKSSNNAHVFLSGRRPRRDTLDLTGDERTIIRVPPGRQVGVNLDSRNLLEYIYCVLHSPAYRRRYAEYLKNDFPRLPLPNNPRLVRELTRLGGELTALHLLESPRLARTITEFIGDRHPEVEKISWSRNTVWLDKAQSTGFRGVSEEVWNFTIGGYQVCNKWLKDRKRRTLTEDEIAHYQQIVVALAETIRLMTEIDEVIEQHGGWPGAFAAQESAS